MESKRSDPRPMVRRVLERLTIAISVCILLVLPAHATTCLAPPRPFVPSNPADAREYADLIQQDFETYLKDIQHYFRCLDAERTRAFAEAQEVSQEYGRFLDGVRR